MCYINNEQIKKNHLKPVAHIMLSESIITRYIILETLRLLVMMK